MAHQLLLVGPADGDFHVADFHCVLEGVNVLDAIEVHHEVAAYSHKAVCRQFLKQVLQRSLHIELAVTNLQGTVLSFNFDVEDVVKGHFAEFVADFGVNVLVSIRRRFDPTVHQVDDLSNRHANVSVVLPMTAVTIAVAIAIAIAIAVAIAVAIAIAIG